MEWTPHLIGLEVSKWKLDHPLVPQTEASIMQVATVGIGPVEQFLLEEGKTRLDQEYTITLPVADIIG